MNCPVIAVLAAMVFSFPAMAQQPAGKIGEQDPRCQVERDRDRDRDRHRDRHVDRDRHIERRADGVAKSGEPNPCAPKPHATRAGDPNPYATKAGAPNPYATRAGDPNPYATKAGTPKR